MIRRILAPMKKLWNYLKAPAESQRQVSLVLLGENELVKKLVNRWNNWIACDQAGGAEHKPPVLEERDGSWKSRINLDGWWHDLIVTPGDADVAINLPNGPVALMLLVGADANDLRSLAARATEIARRHVSADVRAAWVFAEHEQFDDRIPCDARLFPGPTLKNRLVCQNAPLGLLQDLTAPNADRMQIKSTIEQHLAELAGHSPGVLVGRWHDVTPACDVLATNRIELTNAYTWITNPAGPTPELAAPGSRTGALEALQDAIDWSRDRLNRPTGVGLRAWGVCFAMALVAVLTAVHYGLPAAEIRRYRQLIGEKGADEVQQTALEKQGFSTELRSPIPKARLLERINSMLRTLGNLSNADKENVSKQTEQALAAVQADADDLRTDTFASSPEGRLLADEFHDPRYRILLRRVTEVHNACRQTAEAVQRCCQAPGEGEFVAAMSSIASMDSCARGISYVQRGGSLNELQADIETWLARLCEKMINLRPQFWRRGLLEIGANRRAFLARLNVPANPWGESLAESALPEGTRYTVSLQPTCGPQWFELWLRKKSGRAFVLHTNTLACYAVRQGGADYTHPISRPDVVRRPDGSVELDASSLVVTAIRVAKAPDFALIPVEVLVDDRPQPTLLWSLASGLKKKHASLRVTPESAAPLIEEALSPLASRDPWAIEQPAAGLASHIVRQGTSEKTP